MIPSPVRIAVVLGVLLLTLFLSHRFSRTHDRATSIDLETLPNVFLDSSGGQWQGSPSEGLGVRELDILSLDQYIKRFYTFVGDSKTDAPTVPVNVYVGFWKHQTGDSQGAKHSPSICLPSSGWVVDSNGVKDFTLKDGTGRHLRARQVVGSIMGQKALFTFWFYTSGRTFYDEWKTLIYVGVGALLQGRTDGGIVTLSVPFPKNIPEVEAKKIAEGTTTRFVETFAGKLSKVLELPDK